MTISNFNISIIAKYYKEYVEKYKKTPGAISIDGKKYNYRQCAYFFAKLITTENKSIKPLGVKKASAPNGDKINEKVEKNDYIDMAERLVSYIEKNKRLPNYVITKKSKKKVRTRLYIYAFAKIVLFYYQKKRLPKTCLFDSNSFKAVKKQKKSSSSNNCKNPYKNKGHATSKGCDGIGQNTPVYCAPHSMQEVIRKLTGKVVPQSTLASWAGTSSAGTGHDGIRTAIARFNKTYGYNLAVEEKSFSDLGWEKVAKLICQSNIDIIWHVKYRLKWGHYETVNEINTSTKRLKVQNSLGDKCTSTCYCGYVEDRSFADMQAYMNLISQESLLIITKK